jgi:hypothetical protein
MLTKNWLRDCFVASDHCPYTDPTRRSRSELTYSRALRRTSAVPRVVRTDGGRRVRGRRYAAQRAAHTVGMPVRVHHIVVDAHDLPAWRGSGPKRLAGRFFPSARSSSGPARTHPSVLHAGHRSQVGQELSAADSGRRLLGRRRLSARQRGHPGQCLRSGGYMAANERGTGEISHTECECVRSESSWLYLAHRPGMYSSCLSVSMLFTRPRKSCH